MTANISELEKERDNYKLLYLELLDKISNMNLEKEDKRNPVYQPKPGDIIGKGDEYRKVNSYIEYEGNIFITFGRKTDFAEITSFGNKIETVSSEYYGDLQVSLEEWQAWAKNQDFVRRRKK